jgi:hypothetical protein
MMPPPGGAISRIAYDAHAQNETGRRGEVVDGESRDNSAGEEYGAPEPDETNFVASWFNTETPSLRFAEPSSAQGVGGEDGSIIR